MKGMSTAGIFLCIVSLFYQIFILDNEYIMCIIMTLFQLLSFVIVYNTVNVLIIRRICIVNYIAIGLFILVGGLVVLYMSDILLDVELAIGGSALLLTTSTVFYHIQKELFK